MLANHIIKKFSPFARHFGTTALRQSEHDTAGVVGSNLPFQIKNRYRFTLVFIIFCGSGLALPFLILRRGLLKQKSG